MKVEKLIEILNEISPFELQEDWDNSGLQVGDLKDECVEIFVALDLDEKMLEDLPENSTLLTHHPLIFSPLKKVERNSYPSKFIYTMIRKNINLISLHTNFDKTHLNKYVAEEILKLEVLESDDFILRAKVDGSFDEILKDVKEKLGLEKATYVKTKEHISSVALTTGAGGSLVGKAGADLFLTGDIKYHDAMLAKSLGVSLIDITHYESEKYFAEILVRELENNKINGIIRVLDNPLKYQ